MHPQVSEPSYALTLLGDVRWHATAIAGQRARTLLAMLVLYPRDGVTDARLVEAIWGDAPPANPAKALQVVVSRARAATCQEAITRTARGYRLGLPADEVDALALARLTADARSRLDAGEVGAARTAAQAATELPAPDDDATPAPLGTLRRRAAEQHRQARRLLGMARSAEGEHHAALGPLLEAADRDPSDERLLACLLRSEAVARGTGAALDRYERYRTALADRTGADPGPELRGLHAELLAADHPVRDGVRFEATELLGRDGDVRALRALLRVSRIVSIVGPGGLGKTRLAHVLGRGAEQPAVRMVELVGVAAPEDVVGELGSALGVRDSVTTRRALTAAQRADVRSRIAAHLDRVPTLLILDNCEHVVDAVAELVAFLVLHTGTLRVLATSRAPCNVAGERVYALDQLGAEHAAQLFRQRALAARPGAVLPEGPVREVVGRLDGLPLAIELAAAKVRAMSVEDIAARLENRFALLRGGDRSAPDRHQTLIAVIDWSWNLLAERHRTALRWLSVFHDGFGLPAAESVLGDGALDSVQNLADQSLVTVRDTAGGARYGMLETVREFGRMQLVDAGEDAAARAAQSAWAREHARAAEAALHGPGQVAAMDRLRAEETNLADVLRRALGQPDPQTVVTVLAALAHYWTIRGEHERLLALVGAVDGALSGWVPAPELADEARLALAAVVKVQFMVGRKASGAAWELLRELGPESSRPEVRALATVTLAADPNRDGAPSRLRALCDHADRLVATHALLDCAHELENAGDPETAIGYLERALALSAEGDGPWLRATLHTQLAHMHAQLGRHAASAAHGRQALPVLDRLDAHDDTIAVRSLIAAAALTAGRLAEAETLLAEVRDITRRRSVVGDSDTGEQTAVTTIAADLTLARGERREGLRLYREAARRAATVRMPGLGEPTGFEPWTLFVQSATLVVHAVHGADGDGGGDLFDALAGRIVAMLQDGRDRLDFPVAGMVFFGLAMWGLHRRALPADGAIRLAAYAEGFGYSRMVPTMAWHNAATAAERAEPGLLDAVLAEFGDRRGEQLLGEARAFTERLLAGH